MPSRPRRCCVSKARPPAHGPPLPLEDEELPPSAAENAGSHRDDDEASAPRAATGTGSQDRQAEEGWLAELRTLKPSALRRRVGELGLDRTAVDSAEDSDDPEASLVALILANGDPQAALRDELRAMTLDALKKRASQMAVDLEQLDEADDADDVKQAVLTLVLSKARESTAAADSDV